MVFWVPKLDKNWLPRYLGPIPSPNSNLQTLQLLVDTIPHCYVNRKHRWSNMPHLHPVGVQIDGNLIFPPGYVFAAHGPNIQILQPQQLRLAEGAQASSTGRWFWWSGGMVQSFWVQLNQETGISSIKKRYERSYRLVLEHIQTWDAKDKRKWFHGAQLWSSKVHLYWIRAKCHEYPRNSKCGGISNSRSPTCPGFARFAWPLFWLWNRHRVGANGPCCRHIFESGWSWMVVIQPSYSGQLPET